MKKESINVKKSKGQRAYGRVCREYRDEGNGVVIITSKNPREFREATGHRDISYRAKHSKHRPPHHVV